MKTSDLATSAFRFVLIIAVANLFADMTYEGARGVTGPFLGSLGASATNVGFVAGFGELIGYSLRSVSGYLADKSSKYWIVTFVGYLINMLAVPALALAGNWPLADYEIDGLKEGFDDVAKLLGDDIAQQHVGDAMAELEKSVDAKNRDNFVVVFDKLSAGCNACHRTLDHAFIVIQRPAQLPYSNQNFSPQK